MKFERANKRVNRHYETTHYICFNVMYITELQYINKGE